MQGQEVADSTKADRGVRKSRRKSKRVEMEVPREPKETERKSVA